MYPLQAPHVRGGDPKRPAGGPSLKNADRLQSTAALRGDQGACSESLTSAPVQGAELRT